MVGMVMEEFYLVFECGGWAVEGLCVVHIRNMFGRE